MSQNFENRLKIMYDRKRRSVDKLEAIKFQEAKNAVKDCTFRPMITDYCIKHHIKTDLQHKVFYININSLKEIEAKLRVLKKELTHNVHLDLKLINR